jgi:uncharacterized phage protein gp47/JayE
VSGLTSTGYVAPTIEELKADIEADQLSTINPALRLTPDQPLGQVNAIVAKKQAELAELLATIAGQFNPKNAEGYLLDNLCALTGTVRRPATKSTVILTCNVNNGFTADAGTMMANVDGFPDLKFVNKDDVGPFTPAGNYGITFESVEYGPIAANAGTLTETTAPVTGWNSCTNALDADQGTLRETDEDLRARREEELTAAGSCTVDAIRTDLLKVSGVKQAYVFENVTLVTDENGLPGKAIECVVFDGTDPEADDTEIAQAVWDSKPSGSETVGNTSAFATDSQGLPRLVYFSRATVKTLYLEYDLLVDPNFFPVNGADLVKDAAADYGDLALNLGVDVFANAFKAQAYKVPGVLDITELRLGFEALPSDTVNLTITNREIASADTSRVEVTTVDGAP